MTVPFTYLVGWSGQNRWYYGVRFKKGTNPHDLWTVYFTSSAEVRRMREEFGEPDVISVRRTFKNAKEALSWEKKVLVKMRVLYDDRWLNRCANGVILSEASKKKISEKRRGKGHPQTEETRQKISATTKGKSKEYLRGRELTNDHRIKISEGLKKSSSRVGRPEGIGHTEEWKKANSERMKLIWAERRRKRVHV